MTEKENFEQQLSAIRDLVFSSERSLSSAKRMLNDLIGNKANGSEKAQLSTDGLHTYDSGEDKVVEGVFTGEQMLGSDKQLYPVPANYASKSLIVQGSKLKAIIAPNGKITYKIIEEIEYDTITGTLIQDKNEYQVVDEKGTFKVLTASVTFHSAKVGDTVSIRVPKGKKATYGALESVMPQE